MKTNNSLDYTTIYDSENVCLCGNGKIKIFHPHRLNKMGSYEKSRHLNKIGSYENSKLYCQVRKARLYQEELA